MTPQQLKSICPTVSKPTDWALMITGVLEAWGIDTVNRKAMFLAQCLHESGGFKYTKEIWGDTKWQLKYEGHKGLGNINPGDGKKFMGRGLIQLTGRNNYQKFSDWAKDPSIMEHPEQVEEMGYALLSAIWYWNTNNLNKYADNDDIVTCTERINGKAKLGLTERHSYYIIAKKVLSEEQKDNGEIQ